MYVIQRIKAATDPDGKPKGPPKKHFATKIDPKGNVTGWAEKRDEAVQVDDATALKVEDYYEAKLKLGQPVGDVSAEDVEPVAPPVTKPVVVPPPPRNPPPPPAPPLVPPAPPIKPDGKGESKADDKPPAP